MRLAAAAGLLLAACALAGAAAPAAAAPQAPPRAASRAAVTAARQCSVKAGGPEGSPWPQRRLDFTSAWPITEGSGVLVAVIDSGLNTNNPQLRGMHVVPGRNVIPRFSPGDTRDCFGHGTSVTGIIAGQPVDGHAFIGVAPDATILPIKQTNTDQDKTGTSDGLAAAIDYAIERHARVANVSIALDSPTPSLLAAMGRARAAGLVIVAAAGNDQTQTSHGPQYPAAYATRFSNVIAVSALQRNGTPAQFSIPGRYVTVAAPGEDVPTPATGGGYYDSSGTSFATPYVTGTVALMLAADPGLSAAQVRNRIEATADPPPAAVPNRRYGYGVVNPYLAVTAVGDVTPSEPSASRPVPLPAPVAPTPPSRRVQHVALATALVVLGLIVLVIAGAAALRGPRDRRRGGSGPPERGTVDDEPPGERSSSPARTAPPQRTGG